MDAFRAEEYEPGRTVQSDETIDAWVRAHAETVYYPSGTRKISGDEDPMAVLDPQCRVRGIQCRRLDCTKPGDIPRHRHRGSINRVKPQNCAPCDLINASRFC